MIETVTGLFISATSCSVELVDEKLEEFVGVLLLVAGEILTNVSGRLSPREGLMLQDCASKF